MRPLLLLALTASALPVEAQTYTGTLGAGDEQLIAGMYVDWYTVEADAGQDVVVEMTATTEFDPFVMLEGPDEQAAENDDAAPGDFAHSRLVHPVTAGGTFRVGATSYTPGETGAYTLTVRVEPHVDHPAVGSPSRTEIALDGVGPVAIGMTPVEADAAWGGGWVSSNEELLERVPVDDPRLQGVCHYTGPEGAQLMFIVLGGRLAALNTWDPALHTAAGIHVGSTLAEVRAAYPDQIEEEPNMYTGEPVLTVVPTDPAHWGHRLRFETEGGRVLMIGAGEAGAVALPEGCL